MIAFYVIEQLDSGTLHPEHSDAGADRQRYVAAERGLDGLVGWLVRETRASAAELMAGETVVTG